MVPAILNKGNAVLSTKLLLISITSVLKASPDMDEAIDYKTMQLPSCVINLWIMSNMKYPFALYIHCYMKSLWKFEML